ncbi:MAG: hypothetical protein ACRERC_03760 [Candidatus Binatia bacterium]
MTNPTTPRTGTYAGLFLVCLATLMYELLLMRVFSVTTFYHFAFMAVSVAMFGMTVGAIVVYLCPGWFPADDLHRRLGRAALLLSASLVPCFLAHLVIPFAPVVSVLGVYSVALTYVLIAIPFVFSGVVVSVALTRFPDQVGKLYAADLIGAAMACIAFVFILRLTDAPTAIILVAATMGLGALCFAPPRSRTRHVAAVLTIALGVLGGFGTWRVRHEVPLIRLPYAKGETQQVPLVERWNSFSRIAVFPYWSPVPFGWGMSTAFKPDKPVKQLGLNIDAAAATALTDPEGDPTQLTFLKYDITNLAHHMRKGRVLVVGVGGGRDILSALAFEQDAVVGVEINDDILSMLTDRYADFTGHLDRNPAVRLVNDEARSYATRTDERFDILQVSLIDTWAATAAGAFTFTENSLYTLEAWSMFLDRLTPSGVLTFSRWYFGIVPAETYRLVSLATEALRLNGATDPRQHILLAASRPPEGLSGVSTILVSREPFSAADVARFRDVTTELEFDVILAPDGTADPNLAALTDPDAAAAVLAASPLDLSAPTDDRPFFFHTLRWRNVFNDSLWAQGATAFNIQAVFILGALLVVTLGLTALCIVVPLALATTRASLRGAAPLFFFFASIGVGFMLVEISQMQRLNVFLGHPIYGLTAALFSVLLSSGIGSLTTAWGRDRFSPQFRLAALLVALLIFGLLTPLVVSGLAAGSTPLRVTAAVAMLAPLGFFMGMAFPLGMELASRRAAALTPWFWGINGATSVCASVLALTIALTWGISTSFWTGFACYAIALAAFSRASAAR